MEQLIEFEDIMQSLLDTCPYGVCAVILSKPHTNQIQVSDQVTE